MFQHNAETFSRKEVLHLYLLLKKCKRNAFEREKTRKTIKSCSVLRMNQKLAEQKHPGDKPRHERTTDYRGQCMTLLWVGLEGESHS